MLNVEEILIDLGVDLDIKPNYKGWATGRCPLHSDKHPSFSINLETGAWVCFKPGCGKGPLELLISKITNCSISEAKKWLKNSDIERDIDTDKIISLLEEPKEEQEESQVATFEYNKSIGPSFLLERGFSKKILREWEVGWDDRKGAAVIPVQNKWVILRYAPSSLYMGSAKYEYPPDFPKSRLLFGFEHCRDREKVVVTEGPLDCLWLYQLGVKNAVAILGAIISEQQKQLLAEFDKVFFMLDNDSAGFLGTKSAVKDPRFLNAYVCTLPYGKKDAQECTKEEIRQSLLSAESAFNWLLSH